MTPSGSSKPVYSQRWTRGALTSSQRFEIAVGAVLTQNTAWTNVETALGRLIRARCLSPRRLRQVPASRLYGLIRSSGYFRQKAGRLKVLSGYLESRWNGNLGRLLSQPFSRAREELLSLNGIGPETADSILLYAGRHAIFVVDAYTRRIGRRFGLFRKDDYGAIQDFFQNSMVSDVRVFREYHALLVALAKQHCRTAPRCGGCPLGSQCVTGRRVLRKTAFL